MRIIVTAHGNLGKSPERRSLPGGDRQVVQFSLGCYAGKDKDGKALTQWFDCSLFGSDQEQQRAMDSLAKGNPCIVVGAMTLRQYQDKTYAQLQVLEWQAVGRQPKNDDVRVQKMSDSGWSDSDVPF